MALGACISLTFQVASLGGATLDDAKLQAKEALSLHTFAMIQDERKIT